MFNRSELKKYIDKIGIKQKYIAEKTGIPERTLSLILTGKRKCVIDEYINICISLDVPFNQFITQITA